MEPYQHVGSMDEWNDALAGAGNSLVVVDFWATWW